MKKRVISFVLILTIIAAFSSSTFAYSPVTRVNGQIWETEPNDYEEDATIILQQGTTIYPTYGALNYAGDGDHYLFQSKTTQTKKLRVGRSGGLVDVPDAYFFVGFHDLTTGEPIFTKRVLVSKGLTEPLQLIAGHDYIIYVTVEGNDDEIQESLDNRPFRYLLALNG